MSTESRIAELEEQVESLEAQVFDLEWALDSLRQELEGRIEELEARIYQNHHMGKGARIGSSASPSANDELRAARAALLCVLSQAATDRRPAASSVRRPG